MVVEDNLKRSKFEKDENILRKLEIFHHNKKFFMVELLAHLTSDFGDPGSNLCKGS